QMLDESEAGRVLAYLESAPVVYATDGFAPDRIDHNRGRAVPLTWHTDGVWVWPGSVTYYLRSYALPPDPEFVAHIRLRHFQPPAVSPEVKQAAMTAITGRPPVPAVTSRSTGDATPQATAAPSVTSGTPGMSGTSGTSGRSDYADRSTYAERGTYAAS